MQEQVRYLTTSFFHMNPDCVTRAHVKHFLKKQEEAMGHLREDLSDEEAARCVEYLNEWYDRYQKDKEYFRAVQVQATYLAKRYAVLLRDVVSDYYDWKANTDKRSFIAFELDMENYWKYYYKGPEC